MEITVNINAPAIVDALNNFTAAVTTVLKVPQATTLETALAPVVAAAPVAPAGPGMPCGPCAPAGPWGPGGPCRPIGPAGPTLLPQPQQEQLPLQLLRYILVL